jgi:hypothetical protein
MVASALVHAIDAGNEELTKFLIKRCAPENVEKKESVAQLAKSKKERVNSLNTYHFVTMRDKCLVRGGEHPATTSRWAPMGTSDNDFNMGRFMEARVMMSPMLAATSWAEQSSTASTRPRAKAWAAEVIRSLYDLGANFKIPTQNHPEWQGVPAYGESIYKRVIQDPLYQFIKHQIRDVTQQDI